MHFPTATGALCAALLICLATSTPAYAQVTTTLPPSPALVPTNASATNTSATPAPTQPNANSTTSNATTDMSFWTTDPIALSPSLADARASGASAATSDRASQAANTWQQQMLRAINAERGRFGLRAVCLNSKLTAAAQTHSSWQASRNAISHTGSGNSQPADRVRGAGYRWSFVAENVAAGWGGSYRDVASVMRGWMNSPGHRANILSNSVQHVGVGLASNTRNGGGYFWTQVFGASGSERCS